MVAGHTLVCGERAAAVLELRLHVAQVGVEDLASIAMPLSIALVSTVSAQVEVGVRTHPHSRRDLTSGARPMLGILRAWQAGSAGCNDRRSPERAASSASFRRLSGEIYRTMPTNRHFPLSTKVYIS